MLTNLIFSLITVRGGHVFNKTLFHYFLDSESGESGSEFEDDEDEWMD